MAENQKLLEEVMDGAKTVPPEYQRYLLDVVKAMALRSGMKTGMWYMTFPRRSRWRKWTPSSQFFCITACTASSSA